MSTEAPKVNAAGRYSATEACKMLGIHRNTLARWTEAGTIRAGYWKANGRKFYTGLEILKCWQKTY